MTPLRKLVSLQPADRRLVLLAAALLPLVRVALRALPFRLVTRALWSVAGLAATPAYSTERIAWAVRVAARYLPGGAHCLAQALTAQTLLTRYGHRAHLRIGVARTAPPGHGFHAHAWVESGDGVVLGESSLEHFTPLPALPVRPSARASTYELHGLHIRSEIPLGAASVYPTDIPDLTVRWACRPMPPAAAPDERVLARCVWDGGRGYTHTEAGTGYILRFQGLCAIQIDRARRVMDVHLSAGADPAMVPLLVGGNALAFVLTLAGECVLHASAVQTNGSVLAFVGAAGMGKSTLAALLCASGATLVTDDLLRLSPDGTGFRCFFGPAEIRLRSNAAELVVRLPGIAATPTPDGRVAVRLEHAARPIPRLGTVVIPRPMRSRTTLAVRRLNPAEALFQLFRYPRVAGIRAPDVLENQFRAFAQVAGTVPVYEAEIPWGPPFAPGLADSIVEAVT